MGSRGLVSFSKYAALVKNMRGVVLASKECVEGLRWVSRRFRYRVVGVPPSLKMKVKRPLVTLYYPTARLRKFIEDLAAAVDLELDIIEPIALSSTYISPLLVLDLGALRKIDCLTLMEVKGPRSMSSSEWKLHLRIADYSILDSYSENMDLLAKLWSGELDVESFMTERRRLVERDSRRYWRLASKPESTFLLYLDPLPLIDEKGKLKWLLAQDYGEVAAALSIVPAVVLALIPSSTL